MTNLFAVDFHFFSAIQEDFYLWLPEMLLNLAMCTVFVIVLLLAMLLSLMLPTFRFRQPAFAVFKRNFSSYFSNPTGYVFLCLFVFFASVAAFWPHDFFATNVANFDQLNWWLPFIMLIFVPAVTMSIWADETRQGTDELLLTLPATDFDIVIGKYFASVGVFTISLLFSELWNYCVLVTLTSGELDRYLLFNTYLGYWFVGIAMLSIGMVASFLTRNLTVAFVLGLVFNAPLAFLSHVDVIIPNSPQLNTIRQWSLLDQFDTFGRGILASTPVLYFLGIVVIGVYVSLMLIGRRHWAGGRDGTSKLGHYLVRVICMVVIVVCAVLVSTNNTFMSRFVRADLSEGSVSSLSPSTLQILDKLRNETADGPPVVIDAFISNNVPPDYAQTRYELESLLREFDARGGDRVKVNLYTGVEPSSEYAIMAEKSFGIEAAPVQSEERGSVRTEEIILGCSFSRGLERVTVPFFHYGKPVEYELIRSINTVAKTDKLTIGVLKTDANMMGGVQFAGQMPRQVPRQAIVDELEKQFKVESVDPSAEIPVWIDGKDGEKKLRYDVLVAVQPSTLTNDQMDNFLSAIRKGQPTAICEDPFPVAIGVPGTSQPRQQPGGMFGGQGGAPPKGDIKKLWELIGIDVSKDRSTGLEEPQIVWQKYNPYKRIQVFNPEYVFIRSRKLQTNNDEVQADYFSMIDPITSGLEEVLFLFAGAIEPKETDLEIEKLIVTGNAGTVPFGEVNRSMRDPNGGNLEIARGSEDGRYILAAHITGKPKTVSSKSLEEIEAEANGEKTDSGSGDAKDINVVYVTDIDFLSSTFVRLRDNPKLDNNVRFRFQNTTLMLNIIDALAGVDDYIDIRKRRRRHKTLRRIEELTETEAENVSNLIQQTQKDFKEAQKKANEELDEKIKPYLAPIEEIRNQGINGGEIDQKKLYSLNQALRVAQGKQQARLDAKIEQLEVDRDRAIRDIKRSTDLKIQQIQTDYKVWAAVLPPILPMLVGFLVYARRRLREREGVSKSRLK